MVRAHPASVLTVRNSRRALEQLGYRFPTRIFYAPVLNVSVDVRDFYEAVDAYLQDAYGLTEAAASTDRNLSLGFAKSTYYQRLASSFVAAERTLERRLMKLQALVEGTAEGLDLEELDDEGEAELPEISLSRTKRQQEEIERTAGIERMYVNDLLSQLRVIGGPNMQDPKIVALTDQLASYLEQEDQVLVFSRYTDTIDACHAAFLISRSDWFVGHAMYTGGTSWVNVGDERPPRRRRG